VSPVRDDQVADLLAAAARAPAAGAGAGAAGTLDVRGSVDKIAAALPAVELPKDVVNALRHAPPPRGGARARRAPPRARAGALRRGWGVRELRTELRETHGVAVPDRCNGAPPAAPTARPPARSARRVNGHCVGPTGGAGRGGTGRAGGW